MADFAIVVQVGIGVKTLWATNFFIASIGGKDRKALFTPGGFVNIWGSALFANFYAHTGLDEKGGRKIQKISIVCSESLFHLVEKDSCLLSNQC